MPVTKKQAAVVGIPTALAIAAAVAFMATRQTYQGTIDASGYHPPAGVTVQWTHPSFGSKYKHLDPSQPCQIVGYSCPPRYGENDPSLNGWQTVPAMAGESRGGTVHATMTELLHQSGVMRDSTWEEDHDFGVTHNNGRAAWGCQEYEGFTGNRNDPSCGPVPTPTPTGTPAPTPKPGCDGICHQHDLPPESRCPTDCPAPTPTPTATPGPTPRPTPCPTCPPPCPPHFSQQALDWLRPITEASARGVETMTVRTSGAGRWTKELSTRKDCVMPHNPLQPPPKP